MPPKTALDSWLSGGSAPPSLNPDLVAGSIRWLKLLGRPDGPLGDAFFVECYHYDRFAINRHEFEQPKSPHVVDVWEGAHDEHYFRVSIRTDARAPQGYDLDSRDPLRHLNFLEVRLRTGVAWENNTFTGKGGKVLVPAALTFDPPGKPQRLRVIEVVHLQSSVKSP